MAWKISQNPENESVNYVDSLGFEHALTRQQATVVEANIAKDKLRIQKYWKNVLDTKQLPSRPQTLKKLVRKGVPAEARCWVWPLLAKTRQLKDKHGPTYYRDLIAAGTSEKFAQQIEVDLPRTFPTHSWVGTKEAQDVLRNVLTAFAARQPELGYCQSMNFLAATILVVLNHDEEGAFWLLCRIVEDILYPATFSAELLGTHVEIAAFQDVASSKMPALFSFLNDQGCEMSLLATDWFLCLYSTNLPPETALRVWDSMLLEGSKVLYRAGLAALKIITPQLMTGTNVGEVSMICKRETRMLFDRATFMSTCFKQVGTVARASINAARAAHHDPIARDLAEREAARKERQRQREEERAKREAAQAAEAAAAAVQPSQEHVSGLNGATHEVSREVPIEEMAQGTSAEPSRDHMSRKLHGGQVLDVRSGVHVAWEGHARETGEDTVPQLLEAREVEVTG